MGGCSRRSASCENVGKGASLDSWPDKYLFVCRFLFVSDGQHLCRVHKTQRHSPAGHQREGHERLAVRLQPAARRHDKVSFARPPLTALQSDPMLKTANQTKLPFAATDRSWPGDAAECRRTEEVERRGFPPSGRPLNIPSVNTY